MTTDREYSVTTDHGTYYVNPCAAASKCGSSYACLVGDDGRKSFGKLKIIKFDSELGEREGEREREREIG